jgi:DNA-binding MarR family transcriptional regulator
METDASNGERIERILQLAEQVFREMLPMIPREEWLRLDLTMPQLKVVLMLFLNGPARMGALASGLGVSLATATGVIDRLVERGIVLREGDPQDRRVVVCRLSQKGQRLMGRLWSVSKARARELLQAVGPDRLATVNEALEALLEAARRMRASAPQD